jgi:hypothetical protein
MKWVQTVISQDGKAVSGGNGIYDLVTDAAETRFSPWPDRSSAPAQELMKLIEADPDPAGQPLDLIRGGAADGSEDRPVSQRGEY